MSSDSEPLFRGTLNKVSEEISDFDMELLCRRVEKNEALKRKLNIKKPMAVVKPWNGKGKSCETKMWRRWPVVSSYLMSGWSINYAERMLESETLGDVPIAITAKTDLDRWNEFYWPTVPSYVKSGDAWRLHRNMPRNAKRRLAQSNWRNNNNNTNNDSEDDYVLIDDDDGVSNSSMY